MQTVNPSTLIPFSKATAPMRYIAFLDVLGFGDRVTDKFEETVALYEILINRWKNESKFMNSVEVMIYSDSILMESNTLSEIIEAANVLSVVTFQNDCILRGGIAYGPHLKILDGSNVYVVSSPLTHAAKIEKSIKYPCIGIHESVVIPRELWKPEESNNLLRDILFYEIDGKKQTIVNPINISWHGPAHKKIADLLACNPKYRCKYEWLFCLIQNITSNTPLIPTEFLSANA